MTWLLALLLMLPQPAVASRPLRWVEPDTTRQWTCLERRALAPGSPWLPYCCSLELARACTHRLTRRGEELACFTWLVEGGWWYRVATSEGWVEEAMLECTLPPDPRQGGAGCPGWLFAGDGCETYPCPGSTVGDSCVRGCCARSDDCP